MYANPNANLNPRQTENPTVRGLILFLRQYVVHFDSNRGLRRRFQAKRVLRTLRASLATAETV